MSSEDVTTSANEITFKSANTAVQVMMDEYTKERERGGILDNKAIALITVLIALITVYLPIIPFDKIKSIYAADSKNQLIALGIIVLIFISALIFTGITFLNLMDIVKLKEYKRIEIDKILKDENLILESDVYEQALCDHYKKLIIQNSSINDVKSDKLNDCFKWTILSFTFLLISCVGMLLI